MRRHRLHEKSSPDEENPYWMSFSDIMAGLLIIFVLASVVLVLELLEKQEQFDAAIEEVAKAEQVRKNILIELERELIARNIPVQISENDTVLRIPEDVITFRSGEFDLPANEQTVNDAKVIGEVLYDVITKDRRFEYLDTIFVEGHTDIVPYRNARMKGNWGLSTFRAISLWEFWNTELTEDRRLSLLNNHEGSPLFSVSGYASTRPATEQQLTRDERKANRRIDIRFTVKRPTLFDYERVRQEIE